MGSVTNDGPRKFREMKVKDTKEHVDVRNAKGKFADVS